MSRKELLLSKDLFDPLGYYFSLVFYSLELNLGYKHFIYQYVSLFLVKIGFFILDSGKYLPLI